MDLPAIFFKNRDVEVRYKVIYEKEPSEKLKKSRCTKQNMSCVSNQTILEEKVYRLFFKVGTPLLITRQTKILPLL